MKIQVKKGSLTDGCEQVLVNASNTIGVLGSGVSGAIRCACGPLFQQSIYSKLSAIYGGPMTPGDVLITDAGNHPYAKWVTHVAIMDYRSGVSDPYPTKETIQRGCENLWASVETLPGQSLTVAMVALGAGTGGIDIRQSVSIACDTLWHAVTNRQSKITQVVLYVYTDSEYAAATEIVGGDK